MSGLEVAFFLPLDDGVFALFFERESGIAMFFQHVHASSECRMSAYESYTTKKVQATSTVVVTVLFFIIIYILIKNYSSS